MRKNTPARFFLTNFFAENSGRHFTAAEIWREIKKSHPSVTLATLHRNLKLLANENKVSISQMEQGTVFESVTAQQHHHLICINCGKEITIAPHRVTDFFQDLLLDTDFNSIVTNHLLIYGVCQKCQK